MQNFEFQFRSGYFGIVLLRLRRVGICMFIRSYLLVLSNDRYIVRVRDLLY